MHDDEFTLANPAAGVGSVVSRMTTGGLGPVTGKKMTIPDALESQSLHLKELEDMVFSLGDALKSVMDWTKSFPEVEKRTVSEEASLNNVLSVVREHNSRMAGIKDQVNLMMSRLQL